MTNADYRDVRTQVGKDVLKTLAFFFIAVPLALIAAAYFCEPLDRTVIDIDGNFYSMGDTIAGRDGGSPDLDYRTIDVPPLHTNCRCFVQPEVIDIN